MATWSSRHVLVLAVAVVGFVVVGCGGNSTRGFAGRYENCVLDNGARVVSRDSTAVFTGLTLRRIHHGKSGLLGDGSESHWYTEFTDDTSPAEYVLVERSELPIFNTHTGPSMAGALHVALAPKRNATLLYAPRHDSAGDCANEINRQFHPSQP
jgi:hypothetical protein